MFKNYFYFSYIIEEQNMYDKINTEILNLKN